MTSEDLKELTTKVCDLLSDKGYMTGPCTYGPDKRISKKTGSPFYECGWSISARADGAIYIFGPKSMYANWIYGGNRRGNERFRSWDEFEDWVENHGWADG